MNADDLARLPLLSGLDATAREQLLPCLDVLEVPARCPVFREGDESDGLIWVVEGRIRAWSSRDAPVELGAGALFGAIALVVPGKRRFSVDSAERARLLKLRRSIFQEMLRHAPRLASQLLAAVVSDQAGLFEEALDELSGRRGP